jgi:hypothetical protein
MATIGKAVLSRFVRTATPVVDLAWASVAEVALAVACAEDSVEDSVVAAALAADVVVLEVASAVEDSAEVPLADPASSPLPAPSLLIPSLTTLLLAATEERSSMSAT